MNKGIALITLALLWLPVSCAKSEGYYPTSVIQLVAAPEKHIGKNVRVQGYFKYGIYAALHLNKEAADLGDLPSAVVLVDQSDNGEMIDACNLNYVVVSGQFLKTDHKYEIGKISEVLELQTLTPCWTNAP